MIISLNTVGDCTLHSINSNISFTLVGQYDLYSQLCSQAHTLYDCVDVTLSNLNPVQSIITLSGSCIRECILSYLEEGL